MTDRTGPLARGPRPRTRHDVRRAHGRADAARLRRRRDQGRGPRDRRLRPSLAAAEGRPGAGLRAAERGQALGRDRPAFDRGARPRAAAWPPRSTSSSSPSGPGRLEAWGLGLRRALRRQPRPGPDPGLRLRADRPVPRASRLRDRRRDGQRLRVHQRLAGDPAHLAAVRLRRLDRRDLGGHGHGDGAVPARARRRRATSSTSRSTSR